MSESKTYTNSINIWLDITHNSVDCAVYIGLGCWTAIQNAIMDKLLQRLSKSLKWSWHAKEYHCEIGEDQMCSSNVEQIGQKPCRQVNITTECIKCKFSSTKPVSATLFPPRSQIQKMLSFSLVNPKSVITLPEPTAHYHSYIADTFY